MKKEVVFVHTDSRATKEGLLQDFRESLDEVLASAYRLTQHGYFLPFHVDISPPMIGFSIAITHSC